MATDHSTSQAATGVEPTTPVAIANRPGLPALAYRAGTHGSFYAAMQARLASVFVDAPFDEVDEHGVRRQGVDRLYPLRGQRQRRPDQGEDSEAEAGEQTLPLEQVRRGLTTRASDDPALALLDGWATVADVLTFYQERIANEGYLRTATERRSVLELARLLGYAPAARRGLDRLPGLYGRRQLQRDCADRRRRTVAERAGAGRAAAVLRDRGEADGARRLEPPQAAHEPASGAGQRAREPR